MKKIIFIVLVFICNNLLAQLVPDSTYMPTIKTVKLFQQNNQESLPVITLNSQELLELHFDDVDGGYTKNFFYTYVLCNADWSEVQLSQFDFIKGFTQNRISQARPSSIAFTKYVHYQATLPEKNCVPTKAGNYLLKVFLNSNEEDVVFTKRMYVLNNVVPVGLRILQPFNFEKQTTHQKLTLSLNTEALPNLFNPAENIKTVMMQNQRLDNTIKNIKPLFIRGNSIEYDGENDCLFEAGKEFRWVDLRSFRFESDRVLKKDESKRPIDVFVKTDATRVGDRYLFFRDINGNFVVTTTDLVNNWWQTDYANVHFVYKPDNNQPFAGKDLHIVGEFTGNQLNEENKMEYNATEGVYEKTLLLKQAYYSYQYVTRDKQTKNAVSTTAFTEGNYWETENNYIVLVYYKSFNGRYDELVGYTTINSRLGRL